MMNNTVFEDWMDYVSDGCAEDFDDFLDEVAETAKGLKSGIAVDKDGSIATLFYVKTEDGNTLCLRGYSITECADGVDARDIAEENYEVYLQLLWKMFGIEPFKNFKTCMQFEDYMCSVADLIKSTFGKGEDTGDCKTCCMCGYVSECSEVA